MRFVIHHLTRYTYSQPVFPEPHMVRLRPRCDAFQKLHEYELQAAPRPAGISAGIDAEGNPFEQLWFEDLTTDQLEIRTSSVVETLKTNPYDYLLILASQRLPLQLDEITRRVLAPCLEVGSQGAEEDWGALERLGQDLIRKAEGGTLGFLDELNSALFHRIRRLVRKEPGIQEPSRTLQEGFGACRDMAVLFVEVCRLSGIPARFVSGYRQSDAEHDEPELHAWAEVFIPGAGWRGYDPTQGLALQDGHVALAASAQPLLTAPVCGTYRGTGVTSTLETEVRIETH